MGAAQVAWCNQRTTHVLWAGAAGAAGMGERYNLGGCSYAAEHYPLRPPGPLPAHNERLALKLAVSAALQARWADRQWATSMRMLDRKCGLG